MSDEAYLKVIDFHCLSVLKLQRCLFAEYLLMSLAGQQRDGGVSIKDFLLEDNFIDDVEVVEQFLLSFQGLQKLVLILMAWLPESDYVVRHAQTLEVLLISAHPDALWYDLDEMRKMCTTCNILQQLGVHPPCVSVHGHLPYLSWGLCDCEKFQRGGGRSVGK